MFCKSLRASSHVIPANITHRFASSIALIDANNHVIIIIKNTSQTMRIVCSMLALDDVVERVDKHPAQRSTRPSH